MHYEYNFRSEDGVIVEWRVCVNGKCTHTFKSKQFDGFPKPELIVGKYDGVDIPKALGFSNSTKTHFINWLKVRHPDFIQIFL